jgi:hypothetical protein
VTAPVDDPVDAPAGRERPTLAPDPADEARARPGLADWLYAGGNAAVVAVVAAAVLWAVHAARPAVAGVAGLVLFAAVTFALVVIRL